MIFNMYLPGIYTLSCFLPIKLQYGNINIVRFLKMQFTLREY